ncbi:hypothetical protein KACC15558_12820 [Brevibacterium ammoniilyticum]|uniref:Uncharacterized protein n=2 Tax=Brevibacterium ammoniilyticum TaxID=1046555 RepID=A0ABP9U0B9_9MICO
MLGAMVGKRNRRSPAQRRARSELRSALALIIVSSVFVVLGAMLALTGELFAIVVVLFFGACLLAGLMRLPSMSMRVRLRLLIIGCLAFAAACAAIVGFAIMGVQIGSTLVPPSVLTVLAAVGVVFFGGGGVLLALRMRPNRMPPEESEPE